ncbi:MAG: hypothetical protein WDM77_14525 [Steroidobacteraceae bacterium]
MAAKPAAPAPAAAAAAAAPVAAAVPRKKPWLLIGIAGAVLLICGGTGAWLMLAHKGPKKGCRRSSAPAVGSAAVPALDPPFVANFQGDQQVRFLQVHGPDHDARPEDAGSAEGRRPHHPQ